MLYPFGHIANGGYVKLYKMENSTKNCILIPGEDYTPQLQEALENFREETIAKMEALKTQFNLKSLEISHGYRNRIWVHVNRELVINYLKPVNKQIDYWDSKGNP